MKHFILFLIIFHIIGLAQPKKKQSLDCSTNPGSMKGLASNSKIIMEGNVECTHGGILFKTKQAIWDRKTDQLSAKDSVEITIQNFLLKGKVGLFEQKKNKFTNIKGIAYQIVDSLKSIINTLKSDTMFIFLKDSTVKNIVLKNKAKVIYNLFDNKNVYQGESISQGDSIYINFVDKQMQNFKIYGNAKGSFKEYIQKSNHNF